MPVKRNHLLFYRKYFKCGRQSSQWSQLQSPEGSWKQSGGGKRRGQHQRSRWAGWNLPMSIGLPPNSSHQIKCPSFGKLCFSHPQDVCRQSKYDELVFIEKRKILDFPNSQVGRQIFLAIFSPSLQSAVAWKRWGAIFAITALQVFCFVTTLLQKAGFACLERVSLSTAGPRIML